MKLKRTPIYYHMIHTYIDNGSLGKTNKLKEFFLKT